MVVLEANLESTFAGTLPCVDALRIGISHSVIATSTSDADKIGWPLTQQIHADQGA